MRYFIFMLLPLYITSQNVKGKVYDNETTVKGIDVFNLSKQIRTYTDDNGNFTIKASVNDTLSFHSLFHNKKHIILKKSDFDDVIVIELSKTINRLNEILIQNNLEPKDFNDKKEETILKKEIKEDIKRNPHKYGTSSKYGLDVIRLITLASKLFKKKKEEEQPKRLVSHKMLDSLFIKSSFFNEDVLTHDLKIPIDYKQLFFDYCASKNLDKTLLTKDNEIILLDSLFNYSNTFLKIIKASEKK